MSPEQAELDPGPGPAARRAAAPAESPGRPVAGGHRLLYLGVVLAALLTVLTALAVRREWQRRIGQSRADAVFELVEDTTATRPTETPGVAAWLHSELKRYGRQVADPGKARLYRQLVDWHDDATMPPFLAPVRDLLTRGPGRLDLDAPFRLLTPAQAGDEPPPPGALPLQFRSQTYLEQDARWFVVTRRRALDVTGASGQLRTTAPGERSLAFAAQHLRRLGDEVSALLAAKPLPATPDDRPPRLARLYLVGEDGTLVTAPFAAAATAPYGAGAADSRARQRAALAEGRELRKLPELPSFVANEFVFRFDFAAPRGQSYYSGLYLDLGGQGVVATITAPLHDPASGFKGVVAADFTLGVDWRRFAAGIEAPMRAEVVALNEPPRERWRPWTALERGLRDDQSPPLAAAVADLAGREAAEGHFASPFYLFHGVVAGRGAVAALQVAATTWLVILFPESRPSFALLPAVLLGLLLVLLLCGFELSRRRTERAQRKAERELAEKQNLLNTMQVPLMVVDPNTDRVVYGNAAAQRLGIQSGVEAGAIVAAEPRARAHYDRMQRAGGGQRRAYGIPVRVRGDDGGEEARYAIVRSVAVTAPIETLHADQRHRLGILFLLEPEADLALLREDLVAATRGDERRRLAGLLNHGVDTLVRVLGHRLDGTEEAAGGKPPRGDGDGFTGWLAGYLERRVLATAWLLEHWDAAPPLPPDCTIEAAQARATIDRLEDVLAAARRDPCLRSRLHWDNGVLAAPRGADDPGAILRLEIDWPEPFGFTCPLRGGFGLFLGEVVINAVRHGAPGSRPLLSISLDRLRRELVFAIANQVAPESPRAENGDPRIDGRPYGGMAILERLARLFEWKDLQFNRAGDTFAVTWRIPVSERGDPAKAD